MLKPWGTKQVNYKNSGFDVLAVAPTFPKDPIAVDANGVPSWGPGTGPYSVNYDDTSKFIWGIQQAYNPVAIMSFSRNTNDVKWVLEAGARNLPQASWVLDFKNNRPIPGGDPTDFSPYKGMGTTTGKPPDRSRPAWPDLNDASVRISTLPTPDIIQKIKDAIPAAKVAPEENPTNDAGSYVSEYMAYHVAWYRDYVNAQNPNDATKQCQKSGHTHVGIKTAVVDATQAVTIQLDALIASLAK